MINCLSIRVERDRVKGGRTVLVLIMPPCGHNKALVQLNYYTKFKPLLNLGLDAVLKV